MLKVKFNNKEDYIRLNEVHQFKSFKDRCAAVMALEKKYTGLRVNIIDGTKILVQEKENQYER